jgi:hypothetical protein
MIARRIPTDELRRLWLEHGVALCAEAQADGVPCPEVGRSCATCEKALAAWLVEGGQLPPLLVPPSHGLPECGP